MAKRDATDHLRFSPIQTDFAQTVLVAENMPTDVSTAVLLENNVGYKESASVLRLFRYMGFPYTLLGFLGLLVPAFFRDFCYRIFAKNRGTIWKGVKRVTGIGNTKLTSYRGVILGLKEPIDPSWGFQEEQDKE